MLQANTTVAVITDDPRLPDRVHHALPSLEAAEIHCYRYRDGDSEGHTAPDLILLAIPRDQVHDLTATLDTLAQDPALAHLPVLVYMAEAESEGLLEACVGAGTPVPSGRSSLRETDRSLDDGMPGGRIDL